MNLLTKAGAVTRGVAPEVCSVRIALVSSGYAPVVGGLEKVSHELARAWKEAGHEVRVITNRSSRTLLSHEEIEGISVSRRYFPGEFPPLSLIPFLKFLAQCFLFPEALFFLWNALDPRMTDVVSIHYVGPPAWWAVLVSKWRSIPIVVTLHGSDLLSEPRRSYLKRLALQKVLEKADGISTVSHFMLREIENFSPSVHCKAVVISNGFDPSELENVQAAPARRPYGLCVGRLNRQKRPDLLLDAFETLGPSDPGFDLVFLGDGPATKVLLEKAGASSLSQYISFRGNLPHQQVLSLMKSASFLVIPSEFEAFGLAALEARALCRPIVAFKKGALPEALATYHGVTWVEQETPQALAQGMAAVMHSRDVIPETVPFFDRWETAAQNYIDLFSKYVKGPKR